MKKKPINLSKKAVGSGRLRISEDGEHITNGHWLCKRSILKQAALLTSVEAIKAMFPRADDVSTIPVASMDAVVPYYTNPVTYTRTRWIQSDYAIGVDTVLFVAEAALQKDDSQVWIQRQYVDLFGLEEVTSQRAAGTAIIEPVMVGDRDDWKVIVMPQRLPYREGLR